MEKLVTSVSLLLQRVFMPIDTRVVLLGGTRQLHSTPQSLSCSSYPSRNVCLLLERFVFALSILCFSWYLAALAWP